MIRCLAARCDNVSDSVLPGTPSFRRRPQAPRWFSHAYSTRVRVAAVACERAWCRPGPRHHPLSPFPADDAKPPRRSLPVARKRSVATGPGSRPAAVSAASMTKVPDPHIGSTTDLVPSCPHCRRTRAARVSRIGALWTASLWLRLCRDLPDVSILMVHRSSSMRALMTTSVFGGNRRAEFLPDRLLIRCVAAPA